MISQTSKFLSLPQLIMKPSAAIARLVALLQLFPPHLRYSPIRKNYIMNNKCTSRCHCLSPCSLLQMPSPLPPKRVHCHIFQLYPSSAAHLQHHHRYLSFTSNSNINININYKGPTNTRSTNNNSSSSKNSNESLNQTVIGIIILVKA